MNDQNRWRDRVVIVTGASKGIGRATALAFGVGGGHVIVHGRNERAAGEVRDAVVASGGTASVFLGDLRDPEVCEGVVAHTVAEVGRVDVLVNNAGANAFFGVLDTTLQQWDDSIDLDLRAAWLIARAAAVHMSPGGAIVNVSSNHARATLPGSFPYNVAKAGMDALTQALAIDLAPRGIRVNSIAPGYVDTPINDAYFATFTDPAEARASAERLHLTVRLAKDTEIAYAIEFLADARSGSTTGITLTIDGGRSALLQDPTDAQGDSDVV